MQLLSIQFVLEALIKIQEIGSHFKIMTHWDTYLTLIFDYILIILAWYKIITYMFGKGYMMSPLCNLV